MGRFLVALSLLGGCFSPQFAECAIQCGVGCPTGWTCGDDGYCHGSDERSCAGPPDAEIDASAPPDALEPDALEPDAMCGRVSLLTNGDFDDSTGTGPTKTVPGWAPTGLIGQIVLHESQPQSSVHSSSYAAQVVNDNGQVREICQRVTVPVGATELELSLWYLVETDEVGPTPFDVLRVLLRTPAGALLGEPVQLTNLSVTAGWTNRVERIGVDLGGQPVDLCLKGSNDPVDPTTFDLDDLALTAFDCP